MLGGAETQRWLEAAGIPYAPSLTVATPIEAANAASKIGYPVAVKASMPELIHKFDAGGVHLGLDSPDAVQSACEQLVTRLGGQVKFEVQKLIPPGLEMILGMTRDPIWGPLIALGAGGLYTEVLADMAWQLPPVPGPLARQMIDDLRIAACLRGVRGQPRSDIESLTELVPRFADAVTKEGDSVLSVDLNPVIVGAAGEGLCVVDAKIFVNC